jgi:hypothetical protein
MAHARLGGSSAYRWMACPGSINLIDSLPDADRDQTSPYAAEGTAAHNLAEDALQVNGRCADFVGRVYEVDGHEITVDADMADAVQEYVTRVQRARGPHALHIEQQFDLSALNPPCPMFGTADAAIWNADNRVMDVWDLKFGRGVVVEAQDNPQLLYYALGAVLALKVRPDLIRVHIVQPRADHPEGPHRQAEYTWDDLLAFRRELMDAAHATLADDAPLQAGDHCRFCPAKAVCPEQYNNAVAVAQIEFDVPAEQTVTLLAPEQLSQDQILTVLDKAPMIEDWFASIRAHVQSRLESGEEVPGWKLVPKRAMRRWADPEAAERWLRRRLKMAGTYKKTLVSPAQAEQALKDLGESLPGALVDRVSSGFNLAPGDDPRKAVTPGSVAADDFSDS